MRKRGLHSFWTRGNSTVDYLMLTAAVAGIGVPIMMRYFGGPIIDTLTGQREQLVSFLAQDRKQSVPNEWFSYETPAEPDGGPDLKEGKDLSEPDLASPSDLKDGRDLRSRDLKNPRELKVGRLNDPRQLSTSPVSGPNGGGGAGGAGAGAAGAGGASAGAGQNADFFSKDGKGGSGGQNQEEGGPASGGGAYGRGGGRLGTGEAGSGDNGGEAGEKRSKDKGREEPPSKTSKEGETRRQTIDSLKRAESEYEGKKTKFDWWLIIKILIVLAILFLLLLIALGNMRRG